MKSTHKIYYSIVLINLGILTFLMYLWTNDCLVKTFNHFVRPMELIKLLGLSLLILIGIKWMDKRSQNLSFVKNELKNKIYLAILTTAIISSYTYFQYFSKTITNQIHNRNIRKSICQKKETCLGIKCTQFNNLTFEEYKELSKVAPTLKISDQAKHINYHYDHDYEDILPDYSLGLNYQVPTNVSVENIDYITDQFRQQQHYVIEGDIKKVSYLEIQM